MRYYDYWMCLTARNLVLDFWCVGPWVEAWGGWGMERKQ